jgi:hypothetical protein
VLENEFNEMEGEFLPEYPVVYMGVKPIVAGIQNVPLQFLESLDFFLVIHAE